MWRWQHRFLSPYNDLWDQFVQQEVRINEERQLESERGALCTVITRDELQPHTEDLKRTDACGNLNLWSKMWHLCSEATRVGWITGDKRSTNLLKWTQKQTNALFTLQKTTNHLKVVSIVSCFTKRSEVKRRLLKTNHFLITRSNQPEFNHSINHR